MDELLKDLIETLDLLVAQAEAYQRTLPGDNYPARAAVSTLGELASQAAAQASDLEESGSTESQKHPFSPREHKVLQLAAKGLTNKQIAYRLHLSERTVQYHLRSVFNKSGTNSRTEAVGLAVKKGWIT